MYGFSGILIYSYIYSYSDKWGYSKLLLIKNWMFDLDSKSFADEDYIISGVTDHLFE